MHFKEYKFLEIILDTKHLKHKTLLNKSISIFWCEHLFSIDSEYFSYESYTCKSTLSVNLSLSKQGGDVQTDPQNAVCPQEAKQALQDIIGNYILLCCLQMQIYYRQ